jgi:Ca2+-binding EF-hand superfamily protein
MVDPVSSLGVGAWGLVGTPDLSAARQQREMQAFQAMDTDGDGTVSKDEFATWLQKMRCQMPQSGAGASLPSADDIFMQLDANGDGALTPDELAGMHHKMRLLREEQLFQAMDTNGDGEVSQAEFTNWLEATQPAASPTEGLASTTSTQDLVTQLAQDVGTALNGLLDVLKQGVQSLRQQSGTPPAASADGALPIENLLASYLYITAALKHDGASDPGSILNTAA